MIRTTASLLQLISTLSGQSGDSSWTQSCWLVSKQYSDYIETTFIISGEIQQQIRSALGSNEFRVRQGSLATQHFHIQSENLQGEDHCNTTL